MTAHKQVSLFFDAETHVHDGCEGQDMEKASKHGNRLLTAISEDSLTSKTSTYGCPVCRKAHILDLDRLQVRVNKSK